MLENDQGKDAPTSKVKKIALTSVRKTITLYTFKIPRSLVQTNVHKHMYIYICRAILDFVAVTARSTIPGRRSLGLFENRTRFLSVCVVAFHTRRFLEKDFYFNFGTFWLFVLFNVGLFCHVESYLSFLCICFLSR